MSAHLRRTKIVATLGPASQEPDTIQRMISAGMDVARFNLSHGSASEHRARLASLREAAGRLGGRRVGVLFDLRGPEIRLGTFAGGPVTLADGQIFTITIERIAGGPEAVSVDYPGLPGICRPGDQVMLDDGNLALEVTEVRGDAVICRVRSGGVLGDRKKINLPGRRLDVAYLSAKDKEDLEMAVSEGADFIAASYARRADDISQVRDFLRARGGRQLVIAKIECREALENLESIIEAADALMVARGDLGVEVPAEDVPIIQKDLIARSVAVGKPVITATQMLESMVERPRPTRAEASDVANAIFDGTDAVMLSAETATGRHPVEAVATMARIAERAERASFFDLASHPGAPPAVVGRLAHAPPPVDVHGVTGAVSMATVTIAARLGAGAIVATTTSGYTARMVSRHRPAAPIIAVTSREEVARQQSLTWGVYPVRVDEAGTTDEMFLRAAAAAGQSGLVDPGSIIVITAGAPPGTVGSTNLIKVHTLGKVLVRGRGLLPASITGRVRLCRKAAEAVARVEEGDILVAPRLDEHYLPALQRAAGWVVEVPSETSFAAVQARAMRRVAIIGAAGAMQALTDGATVTLDGARGLVYEGKAAVL